MIGQDWRIRSRHDSRGWMVTFADLLALLLSFFVLLFSMSSVKHDAWKALVETLSDRLSASSDWKKPWLKEDRNVARVLIAKAVNLDYLARVLEDKIAASSVLKQALVLRQDDRLVLSLPARLLFKAGGAAIDEAAAIAVNDLAGAFRLVANQVEVVGHSDPTPLGEGNAFASNWELSLARAAVIAEVFVAAGYPRQLSAYGVADAHYFDLDKSLPEETRFALARRVDIIVRAERGEEVRDVF